MKTSEPMSSSSGPRGPRLTRRAALWATLAGSLLLGACAQKPTASPVTTPAADRAAAAPVQPPILFLHGNGDGAAQWMTTVWRFESNGWPRDRLFPLLHPNPWARTNDEAEQPGRTSTAEHMAFLSAAVDDVRKKTGADKVVLVGNSRGGNAIRNYIVNGGGADKVSHAILGGTPNHGTSAIPGFLSGSEFSGLSPFLQQLNAPKNDAGDEVVGPVQWLTLRSDSNDLFAQPDGKFLGRPGQPTNVTYDGPALKGALNVVLPGVDHRETSYSRPAFEQAYRFITGLAPQTLEIVPETTVRIQGRATGLGLDPLDPSSGNSANNRPLPGAKVEVFHVDATTGERVGAALSSTVVGGDGVWGPADVKPNAPVELVISSPGYATTHYYRAGFARSSTVVDLRGARVPVADAFAPSIVYLWRPRGYLDPSRAMKLDGNAPPNVFSGSYTAISKITPAGDPRAVVAEFEGERIIGRTWSAKDNHLVYLEVTH